MEIIKFIINDLYLYVLGALIIFFLWNYLTAKKVKLLPELIPYPMHYKNVRAVLSNDEWKAVAKTQYAKSQGRCDICGARGRLECHEVWEFNDSSKVQKLSGLTGLCKDCHRVKHIGLARKMGWFEDTLDHMCKINKISRRKALKYIEYAETQVKQRNFEYSLDLRYLNNFSDILSRKYTKRENDNCKIIQGNY